MKRIFLFTMLVCSLFVNTFFEKTSFADSGTVPNNYANGVSASANTAGIHQLIDCSRSGMSTLSVIVTAGASATVIVQANPGGISTAISDNIIDGNIITGLTTENKNGIQIDDGARTKIINNKVISAGAYGIDYSPPVNTPDGSVIGNTVTGSTLYGIRIQNGIWKCPF